MRKVAKEITRNWIQEEHATLKEQTSTHIQMIVSAIEASNKELKRTIKKGNKKTRATVPKENKKLEKQKTSWKIAEELQKMLVEIKNNEACESPILKKD